MRFIMALVLGGALALSGCGDDSGAGGSGGGSAGTGGAAGTGGQGGSGGAGTAAPFITMVAWEAAPGCAPGTRSDVVITVTASDPDTDPADLTYSGNVGGCNGSLDAATSTVSCPNAATYPSTVMVSDPDGNDSTLVTFAVPICGTGDCTTDPNTCGS